LLNPSRVTGGSDGSTGKTRREKMIIGTYRESSSLKTFRVYTLNGRKFREDTNEEVNVYYLVFVKRA